MKPNLKDKILPLGNHFLIEDGKISGADFDIWWDILMQNIARLESEAVEVWGQKFGETWNMYSAERREHDTHRAYLIGIEPIQKGVTKDELIEFLGSIPLIKGKNDVTTIDLLNRLQKEGVRD